MKYSILDLAFDCPITVPEYPDEQQSLDMPNENYRDWPLELNSLSEQMDAKDQKNNGAQTIGEFEFKPSPSPL